MGPEGRLARHLGNRIGLVKTENREHAEDGSVRVKQGLTCSTVAGAGSSDGPLDVLQGQFHLHTPLLIAIALRSGGTLFGGLSLHSVSVYARARESAKRQ